MGKININVNDELTYTRREALNTLRTNMQFSGVNLKSFLFTSCGPDEGKSTISFDVARTMAKAGKKVIYVDADIRKSVFISRYKVSRVGTDKFGGLSHYLAGVTNLENIICETNYDNLSVIFAGTMVPNPADLLGSERFDNLLRKLENSFDVVIIDSPPLGSVIDAAIMAPKCDGTILVISAGDNRKKIALEVKNQLEVAGCNILGVVLNKVKIDMGKYGRYYGRYE